MSRTFGTVAVLGWVWHYARRRWPELTAVLFMMAVTIVLNVLRPWPMVFLIDYVLKAHPMPDWVGRLVDRLPGAPDPATLVGWSVAATLVLFVLGWAGRFAAHYADLTLGQRMTYDVASDLFQRMQQLSLRFHTSRAVGDSIRRVTTDCRSAATIFKDALLPVLSALTSLGMMFAIMWQVHPMLTLLSLAVVPCMALTLRSYAGPMLERSYLEQESESRVYQVVERTFTAIPAVQAFGREEINEASFRQATQGALAAALSSLGVQLQFKILVGLATAVGTAAVLWLGARAVMAGDMTIGMIVLFLSYLGSLYGPIESLMYTGSTLQQAGGSARRVLDIMKTEPEVADRPGAVALAPVRGEIVFEEVSFAYEPARPVLKGISFRAAPGETLALVGPTGAGKSTLVSLIPRFFDPGTGRVLIDGHDLREVRLASLRRQVALVLQEPFLFPISVAENIAYGRPDADMAEIEAAARAANAHDFITRLPQGYATVLGERGGSLSGGERQRLSIARALLKDAPILILDEPTSALDAETEHLVIEALQRLMAGRTTLIIAHRLSTVRRADRVMVVRDGSIAEIGTHQELMRRGGLYARYVRLQQLPSPAETSQPAE